MDKKLKIKYYGQEPYQCGLSCIRMVLSYFNKKLKSDELVEIKKSIQINKPKSMYPEEIINILKRKGLIVSDKKKCFFKTIKNKIDCDIPIIAFIEEFRTTKKPHFVVIKGYNTNKNYVYINDPQSSHRKELNYKTFSRNWKLDNYNHYAIYSRKK